MAETSVCDICSREVEQGKRRFLRRDDYEYVLCADCHTRENNAEIDKLVHPLVEQLCNHLNGRLSEKELGEALFRNFIREHRYLQGSFFTALFVFFGKYKDADYDARNEGAVNCARKWYEAL